MTWISGELGPVFFSLLRTVWRWGLPNLISNGYQRLFLLGMRMTTHHHLMLRLKICGAIPPLMAWCFVKYRGIFLASCLAPYVSVLCNWVVILSTSTSLYFLTHSLLDTRAICPTNVYVIRICFL